MNRNENAVAAKKNETKNEAMNEVLKNKIDFTLFLTVRLANPNGDPLNGNQPRTDIDGIGYLSQECIKRKIRNRLQDIGEPVLLQSPDRIHFDGATCTLDRVKMHTDLVELMTRICERDKTCTRQDFIQAACEKWLDVRLFGGTFAYKYTELSGKKGNNSTDGFSAGIRGAVSISIARSLEPIDIESMQITKVQPASADSKSDTMGMRHMVKFAVYRINGSIDAQLAQRNGVTMADVEAFKQALLTLFQGDMSSARPDGSMAVKRLYWWEHNDAYPSASAAQIQDAFKIEKVGHENRFEDYKIDWELEGCVEPEIINL